jgi:hypothetical protein
MSKSPQDRRRSLKFIVIVFVKRDREFNTSTNTFHEHEIERGDSRAHL